MTSITPPTHVDTAILGAGISGLTAAHFAKRAGKSVALFEASPRAGGSIRSERKDAYLLEYGPNTVLPTVEIMELINDLELSDQLLLGDAKLPRFVQYQGMLHAVPISPMSLIKSTLLSRRGLLRILAEPFIGRAQLNGEESLMSFAERRIGKEGAERLLAPFVSGVWAGDATKLSAAGSFPKLVSWERTNGSLLKGMIAEKRRKKKEKAPAIPRGLLSFNGGLETLITALTKSLQNELSLNSPIRIVTREQNKWIIKGSGFEVSADNVVFAIPADDTASLLEPISPEAAQNLLDIPYAPLAVLHLAVKTSDVKSDLHGFGHLIAPSENLETLGCLYSSSIFSNRAPKDTTLLTVFVGGARFPKILELTDQELLKKAVLALQPIMGLQRHPELLSLVRYPRAIPQYTMGHAKRVEVLNETEQKFPGLKFAGNYVGGISVGDVIRRAKSAIGK